MRSAFFASPPSAAPCGPTADAAMIQIPHAMERCLIRCIPGSFLVAPLPLHPRRTAGMLFSSLIEIDRFLDLLSGFVVDFWLLLS
jgi:hypothetical protein